MGRIGTAAGKLLVVAALLGVASSSYGDDSLSDSVERYLQNVQDRVQDTKLWKIRFRPSLRESVIWTDNVFLNDVNEDNVHLNAVFDQSTGEVITDPDRLAHIEQTQPEFAGDSTQGRQSDFVIQTELGCDLDIPVNDQYFKIFGTDHIQVLSFKLRNQEYLDLNDLDNNSIYLSTDWFGFLSDLFHGEWGNAYWVRVADDYSKVSDPLDASIRLLSRNGVTTLKTFSDFQRTENSARIDGGWRGNKLDLSTGYENYHLWLEDPHLQQAQHTRHGFHAEAGYSPDFLPEKRVYARVEDAFYRFDDAPIFNTFDQEVGEAQILNDANDFTGVIGAEGRVFSEKLYFKTEAGYEYWKPQETGLSGDTSTFSKAIGMARFAYKPWGEERDTRFQLEYERHVEYSAISNYNRIHEAQFSVIHELIPKRLDGDFSVSFSTIAPSQGPHRKLFETGVGAVYHLYKQVDVTLRYLFRHETSDNEIVTNSAFRRGPRLYSFDVTSDGDFYQNMVELAVELHF